MKKTGLDSSHSWIVAVASCVTLTFVTIPMRLGSQIFVSILERYGIDRNRASFPFTVAYCARSLSGPFAGYFGEKIGLQKVTQIGCLLCAVGIGGCFFAESIITIDISFGLIFGCGLGWSTAVVPEIINQHFKKHRAKGQGVVFGGSGLLASIAPPILELILLHFGTTGAFLILSAVILNSIPATLLLTKPKIERVKEQNSNKFRTAIEYTSGEKQSNACYTIGNGVESKSCQKFDSRIVEFQNELTTPKLLRVNNESGIFSYSVAMPAFASASLSESLQSTSDSSPVRLLSYVNIEPLEFQKGVKNIFEQHSLQLSNHWLNNKELKYQMQTPALISAQELKEEIEIFDFLSSQEQKDEIEASEFLSTQELKDKMHSPAFPKTQKIKNKMQTFPVLTAEEPKDQTQTSTVLSTNSLKDQMFYINNKTRTNIPSNIEQNIKPSYKSSNSSISVLWSPVFLLITLIQSFHFYVFYMFLTITIDIVRDKGIERDHEVYFVMALSFFDTIGRFFLASVTDHGYITVANFSAICFFLIGLLCLSLAFVSGFFATLAVICPIGLILGGNTTSLPGTLSEFIEKKNRTMAMASRLVLFAPLSFTMSPLIGFFRESLGSYNGLLYVMMAMCFLCSIFLQFMSRFVKRRGMENQCRHR